MTLTIEEILEEATPPETVVSLCIRGDLVAEYEALEAAFAAAPPVGAADRTSLGDVPERVIIAQQMEQLRVRMLGAQVVFRFRAMEPKRWSDLFAIRPDVPAAPDPTGDDEAAAAVRASFEVERKKAIGALFDWFTTIIAASCYEPAMTGRQATALLKKLSTNQAGQLQDAAWSVNNDRQQIPFSVAASALLLRITPR